MVASNNTDLYTPFPQPGPHFEDSGPQSSEEGSGLHSPIYDTAFHPDIRYQSHDIRAAGETLPTIPQAYDSHYTLPTARLGESQFLRALDVPSSLHSTHRPQPPSPDRSLLMSFNQSGSLPRLPPPNPAIMEYSYSYHDRRLPEPHSSSYHKLIHSVAPLASSDTSRAATSPQFRGDEPASSTSTVRETRKPSSSAVVACRQCRGRKIRCDSTRPMCHNCVKRGNECEYDPVPKRRGPDKHPGTRQRSCKKRPAEEGGPKKKRKVEGTPETSVKESAGERRSPPLKMEHTNPLLHVPSPTGLELPVPGVGSPESHHAKPSYNAYRRSSYEVEDQKGLVHAMDVSSVHRSPPHAEVKVSPTITAGEYSRKTWWDELVETYSSSQDQS
ncbi:hypothetical protein NEOLEDRAFT_672912 [Neolentinus lepideus HHB14362 ss-1]|uniref:Zn(2)-C6 fungal-type domain-containing protein n=1 Tax=Neolentinus lepideus HHB14362 ss-1 TaxID=1314782 RepID=A0A165QBM1_9AGAM|nr:hypothetical protein NEOLEDRAFT_672912 [Neolentinus lepideus HHB14362 ss-1]